MAQPKITEWLDGNGARYRVVTFDKPVYTVPESATQSGLPVEQIIKSMLLVDDAGAFILACLPGTKKVDSAKVKTVAHLKGHPHFASPEQIEQLLGLQVGAVTALYAVGKVPIVFDQSIQAMAECSLSAGEHLYEIIIATEDLIRLVKPRFADVVRN